MKDIVDQEAFRVMKESVDLLSRTVNELSVPIAQLGDAVARRASADVLPKPPK
jgi:hypothetical protein